MARRGVVIAHHSMPMEVIGSQQRPTVHARADYFTGTVWLDPIAVNLPPARYLELKTDTGTGPVRQNLDKGAVLEASSPDRTLFAHCCWPFARR